MTSSNGQPIQGGWGESGTLAAIGQGQTVLRRGQGGQSVEEMQQRLSQLGYLPAAGVDGKFGPQTEAAVRSFQERNGLTADGIYGRQTHAALTAAGARGAQDAPGGLSPNGPQPAAVAAAARDSDQVERIMRPGQDVRAMAAQWDPALQVADSSQRLEGGRRLSEEHERALPELRRQVEELPLSPQAREQALRGVDELQSMYDTLQSTYFFGGYDADMQTISGLERSLAATLGAR